MKRIAISIAIALFAADALAIGQLADLTVVDRQQNRTLPVYWHEGRAWIEGRPGNEYQIVVRNQAGADVLAVVSVDGVNVVTGETATPTQGGYVIDTWQSVDISGWRKSLSRTAAFYFTELPDSYAARTGRPNNVGVIGAALFRRKPEPVWNYAPPQNESRAPAAEPQAMRDRAEASGGLRAPSNAQAPVEKSLGTGHGRSESSHARTVNFERASPQPEEVIAIYYDSRANLIARGVIPDSPWRPREPQPFPGRFAPDPPARW